MRFLCTLFVNFGLVNVCAVGIFFIIYRVTEQYFAGRKVLFLVTIVQTFLGKPKLTFGNISLQIIYIAVVYVVTALIFLNIIS